MKIAIATDKPDIDSSVASRFSRAGFFVVADTTTGAWEGHSSSGTRETSTGRGPAAAHDVADLHVDAVITRQIGPKAFRTLLSQGTPVYLCSAKSVAIALAQLTRGMLNAAREPNAKGECTCTGRCTCGSC